MAHIKALKVNWLDQAWRISSVIADMPDGLPMGLLTGIGKSPPLSDRQRVLIELLQDTIALHLTYRSRMAHKITVTLPDGAKADIAPQSRDPVATAKTLDLLRKIGVKLQPVDLWAYDAHMKLGRILIDRYVCTEWKRLLPLIVASISGETTTETATLKATQPRTRRIELRDKKLKVQRLNPDYSIAQVLNALENEGVVQQWDAADIRWIDKDGNNKTTATGTFQNWKAQPKR
jgi:hypothetical protein